MTQKNKLTTIALGAIVLLVLTALAGCSGFKAGSDEPVTSAEYVATGTQGIVMNFLPDQPPSKVYTEAPMTFLVEVWNKGTHRLENAYFYLTGYDNTMISMPNKNQLDGPLEGRTQYNPDGGFTTLEFTSSPITLPSAMPNYRPTFLLTACYIYQTLATPLVCVDPNPQDTITDKACTVQKSYGAGSQGAPVAVQNIEAEANPSYMYFRIHIANVGSGEGGSGTVFDTAALSNCPGGLSYSDLNKVYYRADLGGQPLDCEPGDSVRLVNGKAMVFCKYSYTNKGSAYQTPLNVELNYGYKSSISKVVDIENLNFNR